MCSAPCVLGGASRACGVHTADTRGLRRTHIALTPISFVFCALLFAAELQRRLAARHVFVPWGSKGGASAELARRIALPTPAEPAEEPLPPGIEPLQLWPTDDSAPPGAKPIVVDNMLTRWLRPHQREGCVLRAREPLSSCAAPDAAAHPAPACNSCSSA